MSAVLSPPAADPVDANARTQSCLRAVLDAMARPGRVIALPHRATAGLQPPSARAGRPTMSLATAALLRALPDADSTLRLEASLASDEARGWLRRQGVGREAAPGDAAAITVVRADELAVEHWRGLGMGDDEATAACATLIIDLAMLSGTGESARAMVPAPMRVLSLRGPGIDGERLMSVSQVPLAFWKHRIAVQSLAPDGFEILMASGCWIAALPRTTLLAIEQ